MDPEDEVEEYVLFVGLLAQSEYVSTAKNPRQVHCALFRDGATYGAATVLTRLLSEGLISYDTLRRLVHG